MKKVLKDLFQVNLDGKKKEVAKEEIKESKLIWLDITIHSIGYNIIQLKYNYTIKGCSFWSTLLLSGKFDNEENNCGEVATIPGSDEPRSERFCLDPFSTNR